MTSMKITSWNVNGIRAAVKKDFLKEFKKTKADIYCLQETKAQDDQTLEALADILTCPRDFLFLWKESQIFYRRPL